MPAIRVAGFNGVVPRTSSTMLADTDATVANNVKLYSKELRYWRGPKAAYTPLIAGVQSFYKHYNGSAFTWLTWATDVDVVPGPLSDTTDNRLYFTGSGTPKKTNYSMASSGPGPFPTAALEMGVPVPVAAPAAAVNTNSAATWTLAVTSNVAMNDGVAIAASQNIASSTTGAAETATYVNGGTSKSLTITSSVGTVEDGSLSKSPTQVINLTVASTVQAASSDTAGAAQTAIEDRVYIYTYVSTFGSLTEEGAPSAASPIVPVVFGATVTVSGFAPPPTTGYNITTMRIYRSVTGTTTSSYLFVAEVPVGTTSFVDALTTAQLGSALSTLGWLPPPSNLTGIVSLANGSLAGFVGNTVYFSQPFAAHAWPLAYAVSIPFNIVGLGVFGTTVVACTERFPYIISGATPDTMSASIVPIPEPCVAKSSIASDQFGVNYASPNGLVNIGPNVQGIVSDRLFRRDEWQAQNPGYIKGVIYDNKYFGIYKAPYSSNASMVMSRDDQLPESYYSMVTMGKDDRSELTYLNMNAAAAHVDLKTAILYIVGASDNIIYQVDADDVNPLTYTWTSKRYVFPKAVPFSALRLDADYTQVTNSTQFAANLAAIAAQNAVLWASPTLGRVNDTPVNGTQVNGSTMINVPVSNATRQIQVFLYGDTILQASLTLSSMDPVRLPAFQARELEIQLQGNVPVRSVALATSVPELEQ